MSDRQLIDLAQEVRDNAYCPHSNYRVGAAVRVRSGELFTGVNVENQSFGLTCCAERTAIFSAVAAGHRQFDRIAIATADGGTPCGACRQVLAEFCDDEFPIDCVAGDGRVTSHTLGALFPKAFRSDELT